MLCTWWSFFNYFLLKGFLNLQIPILLTHLFGICQTCHLTNLPKSRRNGLSIIPLLAKPVVIVLCATNKWFQPLAIEIDKQANTTNDYCMPSYLSMTWRKCSGRTKVDLCFNFSFWNLRTQLSRGGKKVLQAIFKQSCVRLRVYRMVDWV